MNTRHVDDFIEEWAVEDDPELGMANYARWVLNHMRLPAVMKLNFDEFMKPFRLFCTWKGKRYRVVTASRLGDVGLSKSLDSDSGYDVRVPVDEITLWGDEPGIPAKSESKSSIAAETVV